jgi:hypothetical protein
VDEITEEKLHQMTSAATWLIENGKMSREQVETEFFLALGDEVDENAPPHVGGGKKSKKAKS